MWDYLKRSNKPIVLYGTGNACERIIDILNAGDIKISGIFASDGFVRDRYFSGFKVKTYEECKEEFGDMIVLLCFGSHLPDVIDNIRRIADEQELYAPDLPVVGEGLFTPDYMLSHKADIAYIFHHLEDQKSIDVLEGVLNYRMSGKLDFLYEIETDDDENWDLLKLGANESYLDLGAYTGDTVTQFLMHTKGSYNMIYAVEPEERNFRKMFERLSSFERIQLINAAVGECSGEILFTHGVGRGGAKGKGKTRPISKISVDDIVHNPLYNISGIPGNNPVSFIKMDVEGEEFNTIIGASETIAEYSPKLLVAAYHRIDDLWRLPRQILDCNPKYKLYLRKSPCVPCWEVNYYFVPEE